MNNIIKSAGIAIINFIPSIILPAIFDYYDILSRSEAVLMGILIWILLTCVEILYKSDLMSEKEEQRSILWNIENEFESRLSNIREAYRRVLANRRESPDLFQYTFDERVSELEKSITEAANKDELHINRGHLVSTNFLLNSFRGETDDIFRPVHLLEDNDWFFDIIARQYFNQVYQLVLNKKIRAVKRLMLYDNEEQLKDPRSLNLMKFHAVTKGYSYRLMMVHEFRTILRDLPVPLDVPRDFGIYGRKYIYIAQVNRADNLIGYYMRNPSTIDAYIKFFETCWNNPAAITLKTIDASTPFALDDLFVK